MLASFGFFGHRGWIHRGWIQPLAITAGIHSSLTTQNFKKLQYKRLRAIKELLIMNSNLLTILMY
jgi:hypothetical protein